VPVLFEPVLADAVAVVGQSGASPSAGSFQVRVGSHLITQASGVTG
jgi:hypothetical protein